MSLFRPKFFGPRTKNQRTLVETETIYKWKFIKINIYKTYILSISYLYLIYITYIFLKQKTYDNFSTQVNIFQNNQTFLNLEALFEQTLSKTLISKNCLKSFVVLAKRTTQHKFSFLEIHILENVGSRSISKFKKVGLFWKIWIWVEIVLRVFCCARRAQLTTTFLFSKFSFLRFFVFVLGHLFFENYWSFEIRACFFKNMKVRCWLKNRFLEIVAKICIFSKNVLRHNRTLIFHNSAQLLFFGKFKMAVPTSRTWLLLLHHHLNIFENRWVYGIFQERKKIAFPEHSPAQVWCFGKFDYFDLQVFWVSDFNF